MKRRLTTLIKLLKILLAIRAFSWFERWQMARGEKLRDEPRVSKNVEKIWNDAKAGK